jgi:hypothetical protein
VRVKYFHPMHFDTSTGRYVLDLPTVVPKVCLCVCVCVRLCRGRAVLCCAVDPSQLSRLLRDPVAAHACCRTLIILLPCSCRVDVCHTPMTDACLFAPSVFVGVHRSACRRV